MEFTKEEAQSLWMKMPTAELYLKEATAAGLIRRSRVTGHRLQVMNIIIILCSAWEKQNMFIVQNRFSHRQLFSS